MNKLVYTLAAVLCLTVPAFAEWGETISITGVKHWDEDDREVHVRGTVNEVFGSDGLLLGDSTGEIHVRFTNDDLRYFHFHPGMRVEVRGIVHRNRDWHSHHWDIEANAIKLHDGTGEIIGYR